MVMKLLATVKNLCSELGISLNEVDYIGNDINDAELLKAVGFAACPAYAYQSTRNIPQITILSKMAATVPQENLLTIY